MIYRNILIRSLCLMTLGIFAAGIIDVLAQAPCTGKDALTAKSCAGDSTSADEKALFDLVTKYRSASGRPPLRLSTTLSMVANRHLIDLMQNVKFFTHGWSNCPYDFAVEKTWPCVSDAPKRLNSGYNGKAFETLYRTEKGNASPIAAIDAWKISNLHNAIILNRDSFKDMSWDEVGVAIVGQYAALWFGSPAAAAIPNGIGIGVSYDQAVAGLTTSFTINPTINQTKTPQGDKKWQGVSADKKAKIEIFGSPVGLTELNVSMNLGVGGKLGPENQKILITLLGNLFPEWPNLDAWITKTVANIAADNSASRTMLVRKITAEFSSDGLNSLRVVVKPQSKDK